MGILLLENNALTISHPVIIACMKENVALIVCDEKHLPFALMQPLYGHSLHARILSNQVKVSEPIKKLAWKSIITQKIQHQARVLYSAGRPYLYLDSLAKKVKSGDSDNKEALAARYYWKELFGKDFRRNTENMDNINSALNYGYTLFRSAIARSICATGLHPSIGMFHKNQYNPYALADDLLEPLRPWIDFTVYQSIQHNQQLFDKSQKIRLLELLTLECTFDGKKLPVLLGFDLYAYSLKQFLFKEIDKMEFPIYDFRRNEISVDDRSF
jgi:CRISP-associated protein Cas1